MAKKKKVNEKREYLKKISIIQLISFFIMNGFFIFMIYSAFVNWDPVGTWDMVPTGDRVLSILFDILCIPYIIFAIYRLVLIKWKYKIMGVTAVMLFFAPFIEFLDLRDFKLIICWLLALILKLWSHVIDDDYYENKE